MGNTLSRLAALLTAAVLFPVCTFAQPAETAMATVRKLVNAVRGFDAQTVVDLTDPEVHELMGGRDKMLAALTTTFKAAKDSGNRLERVELGVPSTLGRDGRNLFLFVPYNATSSNRERSTTIQAFYLGKSADNGATWRFVDGSRIDQQSILLFLPAYRGEPPLPGTKHVTERK